MIAWIEQVSADSLIIKIYVQPGASKTVLIGPHNGELKIKVSAPPTEGKANEELMRFIKKLLKVKSTQLELASGSSSRHKRVLVRGVEPQSVEKKLASKI